MNNHQVLFFMKLGKTTFRHTVNVPEGIEVPEETAASTMCRHYICDYPSHIHEHCELIYMLSGAAASMVNGREYALRPGRLLFVRPTVIHALRIDPSIPYERYMIQFDAGELPPDFWRMLSPDADAFDFRTGRGIPELFAKADAYATKYKGEMLSRLLAHLAEEIIYNLPYATQIQPEGAKVPSPHIERAIAYVDEHLTEISDVAEIAEALYITRSHLQHLFTRSLRVSPKQYITSKRLLLARRLLVDGERPTEIYAKVGFGDYTAFYRSYRAYFGHSPSADRALESEPDAVSAVFSG